MQKIVIILMVGLLTLAVSCEKNPVIDPVDPADDSVLKGFRAYIQLK